ncbi:tetratricopeptide repeat protein [Psychroflexus planctonicus]|uniref:Tetratricopeptide repeat-containing protein n=1 Tax=Psychroflexus planctonicus TaxID=1526575 RepID=A0ABQ1SD89_9FLAO|nr:tetratricopeptide repeat protein [Psychroflexus planctonicus]GGE30357.1 hypothetical protein GCM10010832_08540 [Psychroflexus planctonicus]
MKSFAVVIFLSFFAFTNGFAQQSEEHYSDISTFQQALDLFQKKQFASAKILFARVAESSEKRQLKSNAKFYEVSSALKLNEANAAIAMEDFIRSHPTSNKKNEAVFEIGNYYFGVNNHNQARRWFNQVDVYNLNKELQSEYYFKFAYASFKSDDFKRANTYFNRVKNHKEYGSQAKYYLGYIAYAENDYRKAKELFDEVEADPNFNQDMAYFKSDMNFKSGNFESAIAAAKEKLQKANYQERSQLNKIIGESYFNLEEYEEAIPYLEAYEGDRCKWNNTDHYQLGYAYFMQKNYPKAVSEFNKIIGGKDKVAQNAYYHLAQSYLKSDAKSEALNAFKNVSELDFDKEIQQDAFLNYAKLSYEIGNAYTSVPEVLTQFLEKYPNSQEANQIGSLLVGAYLAEKNYEKALYLLEGSRNYEDKKQYQQIAYAYAIELFKERDYSAAKTYFNKALKQAIDKKIVAKTQFWNAEVDYLLGNYTDAIVGFKQFEGSTSAKNTKEFQDLNYNLGYAYFKNKNYEQAQIYFEKFAPIAKDAALQHDAFVRLGDAYFASGTYWPAMEAYNKALGMPNFNNDYAFFQKSLSYGFVDRNQRKIEELQRFLSEFKSSAYLDNALYELGNTHVAENEQNKALTAYQKIIDQHPNSALMPRALSKKGLIFYNTNKSEEALVTFKKLVSDYPNSEQAAQAVNTVRLIYIDQGKTEMYAAWVSDLDFMDVADADIDNATYEAAEKPFLDGVNEKAIAGFQKYLAQFPKGIHALKANFYLGQLLYNKGEKEESLVYFEEVIQSSTSEFTETALSRSAQVYLENEDYTNAIPLLKQLEEKAQFTQNVIFAVSNLMKAYYRTDNFEETIAYADKVKQLKSVEERAINDAYLFSARANMKLDNETDAEKAYAVVEESASGKLAAEALYYSAYFKHQQGNFEASTEVVKELTKNYSRYQEFGFKGLIIMAKNFFALDDAFNATYILESLEKSAAKYPEIVDEAREELAKMKRKIAEKNSSVELDKETDDEETEEKKSEVDRVIKF